MASDDIEVRVDRRDLDRVLTALRAEEDGRVMRNELARNMRQALKPAVQQARGEIMAMPSSSVARPALRSGIARRVNYSVKLVGRSTRAIVKARKTPNIRHFTNAPKLTQKQTWSAHTWGGGSHIQRGKPGWFDETLNNKREEYKEAIEQVLEEMARRIADRAGH